jgi:hypothetical protein
LKKHIYQWAQRDCERTILFAPVAQKTAAPGDVMASLEFSLFSLPFMDFALYYDDNLMVSSYLTLYRATWWRFTTIWLCCCGLRHSKHSHNPCAARMYYLLCTEVLMTSAYPLCSTGSTLVLTTGL